jgi:4-amino-4-deoxy-L-arabinose transferase-like glycosyltransferase
MTTDSHSSGVAARHKSEGDSLSDVSALGRLRKVLGGNNPWVAWGLAIGYVCTLLLTARSIGYSRDESFYFDAANRYFDWVRLLLKHHESALSRAMIDSHFVVNHEHPPLMKLLFGLSHDLFYEQNKWFSQPGISYRLPSMVMSAVAVAVLIQWGTRAISRTAGVVAGLSFALLPRIFHHAHLACFDVPVACMCVSSAYLWSRALETGKLRWSLALGLVYGLTLATKHNAWLLPPAFLLHGVCVKSATFIRSGWLKRLRLLAPAASLVILGPLVLYALWPWLWFDTRERLTYWVQFHLKHEYYNMEFLGFTYWKPPMPKSYALVMTLATVPLTTLILFLLGGFYGTRDVLSTLMGRLRTQFKDDSPSNSASDVLLWVMCLFIFYSPWLSTDTPIFGGTKHWFSAYPFLCLIAARGFEAVRRALPRALPERPIASSPWATCACAALVLLPGLVTVKDMGPWGLSAYMPIVGGASGAATLGLNRTFWGYTTISLAPELNARAPARVFLHDTTVQAWTMHERDGALNQSLSGTNSVTDSDLALYHHEPHMERVEYQTWAAYGTSTPTAIGTYEGVPVIWMYERQNR